MRDRIKPGIEDISYDLPKRVVTNSELAEWFSSHNVARVEAATGVRTRHIEREDIPLSDMALRAANNLFARGKVQKDAIDFIIVVTQTGDCRMPATACIVQDKLGLRNAVGAYDINLGCSGYIYGLATASGLVTSGIATRVLLIAAEKPLSMARPDDAGLHFLHGDAATATVISGEQPVAEIGAFDLGTDGSGASALYAPYRDGDAPGCTNMDGLAVFNFSTREAPESIRRALAKNNLKTEDISLFILHQASKVILDGVREFLGIDATLTPTNLDRVGNTSSASIPLILSDLLHGKQYPKPQRGAKILLSGFGVGLSWGSTILTVV